MLEEKVTEDVMSYQNEIAEKMKQSTTKLNTYVLYVKKIIEKEIENMELEDYFDKGTMEINLNDTNKDVEKYTVTIILKKPTKDTDKIKISIQNTYKNIMRKK